MLVRQLVRSGHRRRRHKSPRDRIGRRPMPTRSFHRRGPTRDAATAQAQSADVGRHQETHRPHSHSKTRKTPAAAAGEQVGVAAVRRRARPTPSWFGRLVAQVRPSAVATRAEATQAAVKRWSAPPVVTLPRSPACPLPRCTPQRRPQAVLREKRARAITALVANVGRRKRHYLQ